MDSVALAVLMRDAIEWRELDEQGRPRVTAFGEELAESTMVLIGRAFPGGGLRSLRENVQTWFELRNQVAHRRIPALDSVMIPEAQATLLNLERVLGENFGEQHTLGGGLSVPLQLSGFRDPGVLRSLKALQSALPVDVQTFLSARSAALPDEVLRDPAYSLRIAFAPIVPASGRGADVVAYFIPPGDVPLSLSEELQQLAVLPKPISAAPADLRASTVVARVQAELRWRFNMSHHVAAARILKAKPPP